MRDPLLAWKAGLRGVQKRQAAEQRLHDATDRRPMIHDPASLDKGRDLGSGPTESMCRATTERLKGVGMRWDGDHAEALMALAALDQSGQWQHSWSFRLRPAA